MAYDLVAQIVVEVHGDSPPGDAEWDAFLKWLEPLGKAGVNRALTVCEGPGPTTMQRKRLIAVTGIVQTRTAVLTNSIMARGAIVALNWVGYHNIEGFAYTDLQAALGFIGVTAGDRSAIAQRVIELRCELLGIAASDLIRSRSVFELATMSSAELDSTARRSAMT